MKPFHIFVIWIICFLVIYLYITSPNKEPIDFSNLLVREEENIINAVVYIAMGKVAKENLVDFSISSVRKIGKWDGDIYILTDSPNCYNSLIEKFKIKTITVPSMKNIIEIKSLKTKLFQYLPESIHSVLYLDADILVAKQIKYFLRDLMLQLLYHTNSLLKINDKALNYTNIAMFPDSKGHYVGFCSGCDKWHTGIIWMRNLPNAPIDNNIYNDVTEQCLNQWNYALNSGSFQTDQRSIDEVEKNGHCPYMITLLTRHLIFAKDYIGILLLGKPTFWHLTGAGRPEEQDYFYRNFILPVIFKSLSPPLNVDSFINSNSKKC